MSDAVLKTPNENQVLARCVRFNGPEVAFCVFKRDRPTGDKDGCTLALDGREYVFNIEGTRDSGPLVYVVGRLV